MFQFESLAAFIQMGGHGPYVWASYLISLVVLVWLVVCPLQRKRKLMKEVSRERRREVVREQTTNPSELR